MTYRTLCRRCRHYAAIGHAHRRWYRVARSVIGRLADHWSIDHPPEKSWSDSINHARVKLQRDRNYRTLCDLVAITSPRTSVKRNLRVAYSIFTGSNDLGGVIRSTRAALRHYHATGEIRGPKTSRFARVLHGDDSVCVVDTWMGRALSVSDREASYVRTQRLAERVIGHVARAHQCPMAEAQAMVWAGMIRLHYNAGNVPRYRMADAFPRTPF